MALNLPDPLAVPYRPLRANTIGQQNAMLQQQQQQPGTQGQKEGGGFAGVLDAMQGMYGAFRQAQGQGQPLAPAAGAAPQPAPAVQAASLGQPGGPYAQGAQGPQNPVLSQMARPGVNVNGVDLNLGGQVAALYQSAPPDIQKQLQIGSGVRTMEEQQRVYDAYLNGTGPLAAKPGSSRHQVERGGTALDLYYGPKGTPERERVKQWVHDNAPKFGLAFPLLSKGEDWHVELKR